MMGHPYISPLGKALSYVIGGGAAVEVDWANSATPLDPDDKLTSDRRVYVALRSAADITIYFKDPADPTSVGVVHPAGTWFELYYNGQLWVSGAADVHVIEAY